MEYKLIKYFWAIAFIAFQVFSSEELPEVKAKHGGIVKKTNRTFLEVVQEKERTSIYITGHDHRNITDNKLSLSAIALIDGKSIPVQLSFENDHYSASPANSYLHKEKNFVLMITIKFSDTIDRASFNLKSH